VQSCTLDAGPTTTSASSSSSVSLNITTVAANAWILDYYYNSTTAFVTTSANSPQVISYHEPNFGSIAGGGIGASYQGPVVTPTSTSDGWTSTGTGTASLDWYLGAISLVPAGGAAAPVCTLSTLGAGPC
jgi:hypothetical protein